MQNKLIVGVSCAVLIVVTCGCESSGNHPREYSEIVMDQNATQEQAGNNITVEVARRDGCQIIRRGAAYQAYDDDMHSVTVQKCVNGHILQARCAHNILGDLTELVFMKEACLADP